MNRPRLPSFIKKHKQRERVQADNLEKLDKIIDNSSEKNRNFFIAYLGLLIYVQAIIFSTTDLQLLIASEGLKLPIIDLNIPLVGFYVVIPIFVIALHFNFLQNLESHHYKLMRWQEAHHNGVVSRSSIYPFLFDHAILEREAQLLRWVHWANSLLCYNLAPITLGLLLIRYSDRQDFQVTAWHYLAFVVDVYLVWKLRLAMENNIQAGPLMAHVPRWRFCTDSFRYGLRGLFGALILSETLLTGMIGGTSDAHFVRYIQPWAQPISDAVLPSTNIFDTFAEIESFQSDISSPMQTYSRLVEWLLPRISINADETVWKPNKNELETTAAFAGYKDWVKYFNKSGKGFQTTCKSLRLASLPWQNLPMAQLNKVQLQGANLSNSQLQGTNLTQAKLQGANLSYAQLQDTNFSGAQLQGTNLTYAQLQAANLSYAQMQGADLFQTELQGADLSFSRMQGANLSYSQLQGTDLTETQLQGANLTAADLNGAIMEYTGILQSLYSLSEINMSDRLIVHEEPHSKYSVFSILGHDNLFVISSLNRSELKQLAETIPDGQLREKYTQRLLLAEKFDQSEIIKQHVYHKPSAIAQDVLPYLCLEYNNNADKLKAVQAFRQQYISLVDKFPDVETLEQNPEYQALLKGIDRKICTLEECANLRSNIESINCKPYSTRKKQAS
ncbi:MAG: pentapeptide repeat-containing protein [Methylobacter sp.]